MCVPVACSLGCVVCATCDTLGNKKKTRRAPTPGVVVVVVLSAMWGMGWDGDVTGKGHMPLTDRRA